MPIVHPIDEQHFAQAVQLAAAMLTPAASDGTEQDCGDHIAMLVRMAYRGIVSARMDLGDEVVRMPGMGRIPD